MTNGFCSYLVFLLFQSGWSYRYIYFTNYCVVSLCNDYLHEGINVIAKTFEIINIFIGMLYLHWYAVLDIYYLTSEELLIFVIIIMVCICISLHTIVPYIC